MKRTLVSAVALALLPASTLASPVKEGQTAPDFTARTIHGKTIRLSALRGKVVVLDFWTTT
jgi:cytochrome oxidase Cu insertion factor (SCO1/SenC/PrrC family)